MVSALVRLSFEIHKTNITEDLQIITWVHNKKLFYLFFIFKNNIVF